MNIDTDDTDTENPFAGTAWEAEFVALQESMRDTRTPEEREDEIARSYARITAEHAAREHARSCVGGVVATLQGLLTKVRLREAQRDAAAARAEDARLLALEDSMQG